MVLKQKVADCAINFYYLLVLSDPKQREIYDKYGVEGIETAWQLGPLLDQSEKLVEELGRRRNALGFSEICQSKTSFTVAADFCEIVGDVIENDQLVYSDFLPKITTVGVSETIETSFGEENSFAANFTTIYQSGNVGIGNVTINWRRPFYFPGSNGITMDNGIGFGARKFISTALMTQFDKSTSGSVQLVAGLRGGSVFPQLNASVSRVLSPYLVGTVQLVQPFTSPGQFSLSLTTKTSPEVKSPLTVSLNLPTSGDLRSAASFEAKQTVYINSKHEIRIKIGGSEHSGGYLNCGIHRKWNDKTRGSATLQFDQNAGVSLRLGITHESLHLILPLRFSEEFSPAAVIVASLIPTLGDFISRNYIYPHFLKKRKEQYWKDYRIKRAAMMERKREEAELAIELMKQNLEKKSQPMSLDLRIIEATYRSIERPELSWPVTVPLQFLLISQGQGQQIHLSPTYRANVLGFFDVAPGEKKETFIKYEFKGRMHETTVPDSVELLLPQRSHIIE